MAGQDDPTIGYAAIWPPGGEPKLPRDFRAEEFSLHVTWRPYYLTTGRDDKDIVPGFYLAAGFANEGVAHDVLSGGNSGKPHHVLLSPQTFQNVLTVLSGDPHVPDHLMNLGAPLNDAAGSAQRERHATLVRRARAAREALAATEQALRDAGIDPEAV